MFFYSRVLPASGGVPKPGQDIPEAVWQQHMRRGEIALFCLDAKSGQILRPGGELPQLPVQECCMIFGGLYTARLTARAQVAKNPLMQCTLYDKGGRWLATMSREGETRRNPGLGLAWLLFQFPLMALYGTLAALAFSALLARYFDTTPIRWSELSWQERNGLVTAGLLLGGAGRLLFELGRRKLVVWHGRAARAPIGSTEREKLYRRLAKNAQPAFLVPLDITLVPSDVEWPLPEKHDEWTAALRRNAFQRLGQYSIPEVKGVLDFWFDSERDLTATIVTMPTRGMWLAVITRYQDASSFAVANKDSAGVDSHPSRKIVYVGGDATADAVLEEAFRDRPEGVRRRPDAENLLDDNKEAWRMHVQWLRDRGITAKEFKRISERRAREKGSAASGRVTQVP